MSTTASGAAHGIIIKRGGQTYHNLAKSTTIVFDKTGTLTSGQIRLAGSKIRGDWDEAVWWQLINHAEKDSCHWASSIISKHVDSRFGAVYQSKIRQQHETPGRGVSAIIDDIPILVGNESHLREAAVTGMDSMEDDIAQLPPSEMCVVVALNGKYAGYMSFVDSLREEARPAIAALKSRGYKVSMMTGDRPSVSHSLASDLNISHCLSRLTPLSKVAEIQKLRALGEVVIMVGDGINDAAALAAADIGIAIQNAHSVALASSDIVLLRPSLLGVLTALTLGRTVYATMQASVLWACVYNAVLVPLAMGFGAPWGVTIPPTMSGTLMMVSSLGVTYNSIRLRGKLKSGLAT